MYSVTALNISTAIPAVVDLLHTQGVPTASRNGPVLALPQPFALTLTRSWECVVCWPGRKDNPFLNFFDGLFSLSSVNDARFMIQFSKQFEEYAVGSIFPGHYGTRLRNHPSFGDQLSTATAMLKRDPTDRRVVITLWDVGDLNAPGNPDVPCNVMILPRVAKGQLTLTVINRSNDIAWGLLNVNHIQFSFLLELMAEALQLPIGPLTIITNNLHGYEEFGPWQWMKTAGPPMPCYPCVTRPLLVEGESIWDFLTDIDDFVENWQSDIQSFHTDFGIRVMAPMYRLWKNEYSSKSDFLEDINNAIPEDWRYAVRLYMQERERTK